MLNIIGIKKAKNEKRKYFRRCPYASKNLEGPLWMAINFSFKVYLYAPLQVLLVLYNFQTVNAGNTFTFH